MITTARSPVPEPTRLPWTDDVAAGSEDTAWRPASSESVESMDCDSTAASNHSRSKTGGRPVRGSGRPHSGGRQSRWGSNEDACHQCPGESGYVRCIYKQEIIPQHLPVLLIADTAADTQYAHASSRRRRRSARGQRSYSSTPSCGVVFDSGGAPRSTMLRQDSS